MNDTESKKIQIIDRSRILRVLRRVCKANLGVLIKPLSGGNKKVRGKAVGLSITEERGRFSILGILIYGVSDRGLEYLKESSYVHVDIVVSNVGLNFESVIKTVGDHSFLISLPEKINTFDRRKNERFDARSPLKSFVLFDLNLPDSEILAPPALPTYENFRNLMEVQNISKGGLCTRTLFPAFCERLSQGDFKPEAVLFLPLEVPHIVKLVLRWNRVTREKEDEDTLPEDAKTVYLFGWEFAELSQKALLSVKTYMKKLVEVDSF